MSQHRGLAVVAIMWTLVGISSLFIAARLFTRWKIVNKIGLDDAIMTCSLVLCYVFAGLITASVSYGTGEHAAGLSQDALQKALLYSTAAFCPGILSFTIPKLGVVALLIRILNPTQRFKWFLWLLVGGSNIVIFGCVIILYAQCRPAKALWIPTMKGAQCWSPDVLADYSIATGSLSAFVDLVLALYPATVLWRLQMSRKRKIGLSITLGLGVCACAVSIYKSTRLTGLADKSDFTFSTVDVYLWTSIEANTIIMAACVPTITPLLEMVFGKRVLGTRSGEQSSSYMRGSSAAKSGSNHHRQAGSMADRPSRSKQKWSSTTTEHGRSSDVESQKSILGQNDIHLDEMNGITRKDEVIIDYESNGDERMLQDQEGRIRRPQSAWRRSFLKYGPTP